MKHALKKYFVAHHENNYHPHFLHTKRAVLYSSFFVALKAVAVIMAVAIPLPALVTPDVILPQQTRIIALVNELRATHNRPPLREAGLLNRSASLKASDMSAYGYFSHTGPNNHDLKYFLSSAGYKYSVAGENLAMGFSDADQLVAAWVQSPTHYKNIIDADYAENGLGLSSGFYEDLPTVYTAMHFGAPKKAPVAAKPVSTAPKVLPESTTPATTVESKPEPLPPVSVAPSVETTTTSVLGQAISNGTSVALNANDSVVSWVPEGDKTRIHAAVFITGAVDNAYIQIRNQKIPLTAVTVTPDKSTLYSGTGLLPFTPKELFSVVLSPSVVIKDATGATMYETIKWDKVEVVSPNPIQKYLFAEKNTSYLASITSFTKTIYGIFFVIFACSLVAMMVMAFNKKRHHHIALQTLGMLGLLLALMIS